MPGTEFNQTTTINTSRYIDPEEPQRPENSITLEKFTLKKIDGTYKIVSKDLYNGYEVVLVGVANFSSDKLVVTNACLKIGKLGYELDKTADYNNSCIIRVVFDN